MNSKSNAAITSGWPPSRPLATTMASPSPVLPWASLQPVGVALDVAELQGIDGILRKLGTLILAVVEQQLQPPLPADAEMVAAIRMRADAQVRLQLAVEDHLLALRAFLPEIVGHARLARERLQLGADEVGEPVHGVRVPSGAPCARARRRPAAEPSRARPRRRRFRRRSPPGRRCADTSAEPTTAASATRATAAACSGVLMPKPTATGRSVWRSQALDGLLRRFGVAGRPRAGDAGDRDIIDEAAGIAQHRRQRACRRSSASPAG